MTESLFTGQHIFTLAEFILLRNILDIFATFIYVYFVEKIAY